MDIVDQVYELISKDNSINTFKDNQDLFFNFVTSYMHIRYFGEKLIPIYKYLLENNVSFDDSYINIKDYIFSDLNRYEQEVTQGVYTGGVKFDDNYVQKIINLINNYNYFRKYDTEKQLININTFTRDYTGSMIILLNKCFLELSVDNIKQMINMIENNDYIKEVVSKGTTKHQLLDDDYIFQYVTRFLFTKGFINNDKLKDDILLNAMMNGNLKDKKLLKNILNKIDISLFFEVYDGNFSNFLNMLENIFDDIEITEIIEKIFNQMIDASDYNSMIDFFMNDERAKKYLGKDKIDNYLLIIIMDYPDNINDDQILYLVNYDDRALFLSNVYENMKDCTWSEEIKSKLKQMCEPYEKIFNLNFDFNKSMKLIEKGLNGEKINAFILFNAVKGLIKDYLKDNNIKIYLTSSIGSSGCAIYDSNCIKIGIDVLNKFVNCKNFEENPECLMLLNVLFHESRHIVQSRTMMDNDMPEDMYIQYKERFIRNINAPYYEKNYYGVSYEQDARIYGSMCLRQLLENNFPYMKKAIEYYTQEELKERKILSQEKEIFELSPKMDIDEAIEKLLAINPDILGDYKGLYREYNLDGTKKESFQK